MQSRAAAAARAVRKSRARARHRSPVVAHVADPSAVILTPPPWYRRGPRWTRRALVLSVSAGFSAQGLLVISGILVARSLGVTDRGHLALLTVVAAAVMFVGTFGVPD